MCERNTFCGREAIKKSVTETMLNIISLPDHFREDCMESNLELEEKIKSEDGVHLESGFGLKKLIDDVVS